eukprot:gene6057-biopygen1177
MMFIRSSSQSSSGQNDEQRLYFECRNCQSVAPVKDACIFESNHSDDRNSYEQFMLKNIRYDVTLPRAHNIPCPTCSRNNDDNDGGSSSVLFIKYDADLKFLYFCERCDTFWKAGGGRSAAADSPKDAVADSSKDATADSPKDAAADSPKDAATDSPKDAATDFPKDVVADSSKDAVADSSKDAAADSSKDAAADSPKDAATDSPKDSPKDAASDEVSDSPKDVVAADSPKDAATDAVSDSPKDVVAGIDDVVGERKSRAKVIGMRAEQIARGAPALIDVLRMMGSRRFDACEIASAELDAGLLPLVVARTLSDGKTELVRIFTSSSTS